MVKSRVKNLTSRLIAGVSMGGVEQAGQAVAIQAGAALGLGAVAPAAALVAGLLGFGFVQYLRARYEQKAELDRNLGLATVQGRLLGLEKALFAQMSGPGGVRVFLEDVSKDPVRWGDDASRRAREMLDEIAASEARGEGLSLPDDGAFAGVEAWLCEFESATNQALADMLDVLQEAGLDRDLKHSEAQSDRDQKHAQLMAALAQIQELHRQPNSDGAPDLSGSDRELLSRAKLSEDELVRAKAAIIEHDFGTADALVEKHQAAAVDEAFEWLLVEGDRFHNARLFDDAVVPYEAALALKPKDPVAIRNLAFVLASRQRGDRAASCRRAIDLLLAALQETDRAASPESWASLKHNLGYSWQNLPSGDRRANIEAAIESYQEALEVRTRDEHPAEWAMTQNNLGNAWWLREHGDRRGNVERAIACYDNAMQVHTRERFPVDWAMTQHNLGAAWCDYPSGDRDENVRRAIECYTLALSVRTRERYPVAWAKTQNNLGNAWSRLSSGDPRRAIEKAMQCFRSALEVRTRADRPVAWATTHHNIGNAWLRMRPGAPDSTSAAIDHFERALEVFTDERHPHERAKVLDDLARARDQKDEGNGAVD